jgi:hypothetical protein
MPALTLKRALCYHRAGCAGGAGGAGGVACCIAPQPELSIPNTAPSSITRKIFLVIVVLFY